MTVTVFARCSLIGLTLALPALSDAQTRSTASNAATAAAATKDWAVPRTPWGDPDLQGLWPSIDMQGTPYERPTEFGTRSQLTDAEFAARQAQRRTQAEADGQQYVAPRTTPGGTGPPSHWGERGNPQRQASLIVDPPDGRLPPMNDEGRKRIAQARSTYFLDFPGDVVAHPFETFEDLGPYDRCISRGALASMLPTGYNMGTEILQIPGYVIIRIEMIHETRIVPLDGRPHVSPAIRSWMGDPRGHWEGDTLVIETTNFNGKVGLTRNGNTLLTSPDLRLVERLTRVAADTIHYEATVEDPKTWSRAWKVALPFTQHPEYQFFEYACHEGNYAMSHILSGARADEKKSSGEQMIGITLSALLAATLAAAQSSARCDRVCLEGLLDRYVDALVARDPSRLPTAGTVKFTENGQRLQLGDGLWHTVTGRGGYRLPIVDVETGQAVMMGTIREADTPTIFVLRVKAVDRRITEAETLVIRNQTAAESLDRIGRPRQTLLEAVPAPDRLPRGELIRIANMYFSGIELNDGKGDYPIHESCARLENGSVTAGDPQLVLGDRAPAAAPGARRSSCLQQFQSGVFHYVTRIRDRRFVALDPERGLAFAFAFFDNASGDARNGTLADGRKVVSGPSVPWTWQIAEVFKIERGKIGPVESVLHQVPYGMDSGWSSWEDAMSSRPRSF